MRLPTGRRRLLAAGATVALLAAALVAMQDDGPAGPAGTPSNRASVTTARQADMPVIDVRLEVLTDRRAEPAETLRNPFRFTPMPDPAAATSGRSAGPNTPPIPVPTGPPGPPPIPLRFIGLLDAPSQAVRVAILSDGRGHVFYGKEGDIIEGRYTVLSIGADTAELSYLDGRGRQTIRLSGQ